MECVKACPKGALPAGKTRAKSEKSENVNNQN
ncbi:MAG: hypothetical protein ACI4JT_10700 [Oscillospiraceae bacterium]